MKKHHIELTVADRSFLSDFVKQGIQSVRVVKRALALLALDDGQTLAAVASQAGVTSLSVSKWRDRYRAGGLDSALYDLPRKGRPIEIDGLERAKITALATSEAPEGYARWSLRLLADKAVELGYCRHLSHNHAAQILKKTT